MNPWPTHAIAACESECDLCCERIFEGDAVCDVGTGWSHLSFVEEEGLPFPPEGEPRSMREHVESAGWEDAGQ